MVRDLCGCAVDLAKQNFALIPLKPREKRPLTPNGLKDATTSPAMVAGWWHRWPDANIGIVCGEPSGGLVVIDIDDHSQDVTGMDTLTAWEHKYGKLPETVSAITGTGGMHLLFKTDALIRPCVNRSLGIDIRGAGSYIVVPPSIHPNGQPYVWKKSPYEIPIAAADCRVKQFIKDIRPKTTGGRSGEVREPYTIPTLIPAGARNDTLYRLGCSLRAKYVDTDQIAAALIGINMARCRPPLPEYEVACIIESVLKLPAGHKTETYTTTNY